MEASALPASVGLARPRLVFGASLLRIRSDDQLVALFRDGSEDAFRVIHDRYRARLHAYTRQMLGGSPHDSEDALQEIFVRAYYGLRANHRGLALRPWLYRVAHNRCIDELRRPPLVLVDPDHAAPSNQLDPAARVEQRDALRRLIADVQRLPEQQRSALLMRELSGMSYHEVADSLGVSVPAVKSLLVRARVGLAQATEARDTSCGQIREELILAHDRGVRSSGLARRHLSECESCRQFRKEIRGVSRQLAGLVPTLGPIGVIANLLGLGGGGGAAASSSAAAAGGVAGGAGAAASAGLLAGGAGHVVTLLAAAVVTAGGAVEIQKTVIAPAPHHVRHHASARKGGSSPAAVASPAAVINVPMASPSTPEPTTAGAAITATVPAPAAAGTRGHRGQAPALTQLLDPDHLGLWPRAGAKPPAPAAASGGAATAPANPTAPTATPPATNPTSPGTPAGVGTSGPVSTASGPAATAIPGSGTATGPPPATAPSTSATTAPATGTGPSSTATSPTAAGSSAPAPASSTTTGSPASTATGAGSGAPPSAVAVHVRVNTPTRPSSSVAGSVAAGSAGRGRVISFVATHRHARHGFTLGTLLAR